MSVIFRERNTEAVRPWAGVDIRADWYTRAAVTGCKAAQVTARASRLEDLYPLLELLRARVEIYDRDARKCWWGYVHEVEIFIGNLSIGTTLEQVYNRVAVGYTFSSLEYDHWLTLRYTTYWADDSDSQSEFGVRELLYSLAYSKPSHADKARDNLLRQYKDPANLNHAFDRSEELRAVIRCRGWYETLGWKYYGNAGTGDVDTVTQAAAIATECGQFFSFVSAAAVSGLVWPEARDGDATGLYEFEELLSAGSASGGRILCDVDEQRGLLIYPEPSSSAPVYARSDGLLRDRLGQEIERSLCTAGVWARVQDLPLGGVGLARAVDPTLFFIEESRYFPAEDRLHILPRGAMRPNEKVRIRDG